VFTLQTLPGSSESFNDGVGKVAEFSLHAGVDARADERQKLERLCRYISRPAITEQRLSLTPNRNARYQLKTPCRDGTTHVIFGPLDRSIPVFVGVLCCCPRLSWEVAVHVYPPKGHLCGLPHRRPLSGRLVSISIVRSMPVWIRGILSPV
jgi:hypothetical protein